MNDRAIHLPRVTRVEVIDHRNAADPKGRAFVAWDETLDVTIARQDDDRTLKIFLKDKA